LRILHLQSVHLVFGVVCIVPPFGHEVVRRGTAQARKRGGLLNKKLLGSPNAAAQTRGRASNENQEFTGKRGRKRAGGRGHMKEKES